ncbi:MAG: two-component system response regulator [Spirochaetes bacterium GWB1_59_5]|nr:MAG: two-component system response regulator [Spirochaetes bacterium GWB1_59_5]
MNETLSPNLTALRIMMIDDEAVNLKILGKMLEAHGYSNLVPIQDSRNVMDQYHQERPNLILLDLNMPNLDGYAILEQLKALDDKLLPPIVVLTAQHGRDFILRALDLGARDYITKPFDMGELLARVRTMLEVHLAHLMVFAEKETLEDMVQQRTSELRQTRLQIVRRLGRASEYRDNETGKHIMRVSETAGIIARVLGWKAHDLENLTHAAPMHDIGKIGIPDAILLKPGALEGEEWEIMKTHTTIGAHILTGDDSRLLRLAEEIALSHHEKWDGSGYPRGLVGAVIPESGLIVAIADVFDALCSKRPYKTAWHIEKAAAFIQEGRGTHFAPQLVDIFLEQLPRIKKVTTDLAD